MPLDHALRASLSEALYLCARVPGDLPALRTRVVPAIFEALAPEGTGFLATKPPEPLGGIAPRLSVLLAEAVLFGALPPSATEAVDQAMRELFDEARAA